MVDEIVYQDWGHIFFDCYGESEVMDPSVGQFVIRIVSQNPHPIRTSALTLVAKLFILWVFDTLKAKSLI